MMTIRTATPSDLSQLAVLFDAYRIFYEKPSDLTGARDFLAARMEQQESVIYVAEAEGQLLGFVQLYPLFSSTRMQRLWLLNDLFVLETQRGKGISVALIEATKQLCRDSGSCGMLLETAKTNTIGNVLYPKTGFTIDDDHNYYSWDV